MCIRFHPNRVGLLFRPRRRRAHTERTAAVALALTIAHRRCLSWRLLPLLPHRPRVRGARRSVVRQSLTVDHDDDDPRLPGPMCLCVAIERRACVVRVYVRACVFDRRHVYARTIRTWIVVVVVVDRQLCARGVDVRARVSDDGG